METENNKSEAALREECVLEFWKENKIFEKSLKRTEGKKEFIFYDGPVTANSKPVLHTMVPFSFKDAIPRYKTMRGYHVRRKGGWDTHGLPVELQVEKKLGLNSKKAIEEYGIAKFNRECRDSVWEYVEFWKNFTERIGYWADQENPYVTYHNTYIESVWNVVKKINEQNLLYKDYKVVPWCPRCGTALSSHELAQGYEDVKDLSVYVKFKLKNEENTYVLAWTTTPWTLPGNIALAVGEDIDYVKVKIGGDVLILAESKLALLEEAEEVLEKIKGADLVGLEYEPLFPFLKEQIENKGESIERAFKIYGADFVTTEDGTGVVHTAVMYGQDDFVLGSKVGLPKHHLVNPEGKFTEGTGFLEGRFVKEVNEDGKPTLAVDIIEDLKKRNLFFKQENYKHSYPHCWRCKTALIYYARDSWYIRMSDLKVKEKMISENKTINWEPAHTRDGRFGEWLKEIKDWAISRERYWGTPLPVWECKDCKKREVLGSVEELANKTKKSDNKYFVMRHGEAESNVKNNMHGVVSSQESGVDHLTKQGKAQIEATIEELKEKKFDLVFVSPFVRTRETLEILKESLGFTDEQITFDKRLGEIDAGDFDGKPWDEYRGMFKDEEQRFREAIHGGESLLDVKKRMADFVSELEEMHIAKNILIISHGGPLWLLFAAASGYTVKESISMTGGVFRHAEEVEKGIKAEFSHFLNAEVREVTFVPFSHNENYELDLHRPYIDAVSLVCSCGGELVRTKEVMDVWFDSGAMPFAQDHYPFENKPWVEGAGYPADFISEAIDQTRGWFYTLHAIGVIMGRGKAFKNVICLGHLLDANGKKMSKSIGNVVNPWNAMERHGADALRLWMYSVNQPGESKNFDEKTVLEISRQIFGLLYNVLAFYELYRDRSVEIANHESKASSNILDTWILAKLNELIELSTKNLDSYKLLEPTRAIREFVGDLSTWYLRRSRERIKDGDVEAKQTLYFVLMSLAKLLAPFAPFTAEDIWQKLKNEKIEESVHLALWPKGGKVNQEVLSAMQTTQELCTTGNRLRKMSNIPIRQPLATLFMPTTMPKEYEQIIKDELNVKQIQKEEDEMHFDTNITPELKAEGDYRELVRGIQDMRKKMGLTPNDAVTLTFESNETGKELIHKFEADMKKTILASSIEFAENTGEVLKAGELVFKVKIEK